MSEATKPIIQIRTSNDAGAIPADFRKLNLKSDLQRPACYAPHGNFAGTKFYERPIINGVRKGYKLLPARTYTKAREILITRRVRQNLFKERMIAQDPYQKPKIAERFEAIAQFYLDHDCPKPDETPRAGVQLKEQQRRVRYLVAYFGRQQSNTLTNEDARGYRRWRKENSRRPEFSGNCAVQRELQCLSCIYHFALAHQRETGVTANPFAHDRPVFYHSSQARHCRKCIPHSADEFHDVASRLQDVLMFQACFIFFTALRTEESLKLRMDAGTVNEPGHVTYKNVRGNPLPARLYVRRSKQEDQGTDSIVCHPALADLILVHRKWHRNTFPDSPYFFPSPKNPSRPIDSKRLVRALTRISKKLGLTHHDGAPRVITGHGLRAASATVRRSMKNEDGTSKIPISDIVDLLGHTSDRLTRTVYSKIQETLSSFLPADPGKVAWARFLPEKKNIETFVKPRSTQLQLPLQYQPRQLPLI